jgi:hypothetical protein
MSRFRKMKRPRKMKRLDSDFAVSRAEGGLGRSRYRSPFSRGCASPLCIQWFGQIPKPALLALIVLLAGLSSGCSQSDSKRPAPDAASAQPSTSAVPLTGFERDLQFIRNGEFAYVWVFSRKDGKPIDKDDAAFLRSNAPQVVDWVTTDDKKRVIGGTNFDLEQGNMPQLRERFVVEDYTGR